MKKKIAVLGNGWAFNFTNSILEGIKEVFQNTSVDIYCFSCYKFHNPDKSENITGYKLFESIDYSVFDGVILLSNLFEDEDCLTKVSEKIIKAGVPAVSLIKKVKGLPYICVDNYPGFYQLINHLIEEHNVKRVGYIGGIQNDTQNEQRYSAFVTSMKEHNLPIIDDIVFKNGDWSFKYGFERGNQIFNSKELPDAIICSNDTEAFGVIRAAIDHKIRIPEQIKIIGCDDDSLSSKTIPSLSTVDTKNFDLGKRAAQYILNNENAFEEIILKSTPVFRQSCGCGNLNELSELQINHSIRTLLVQDEEERFTAHLRHTEDIFINDSSVYSFWEDCKNFFQKRHEFEGTDFSILLKDELTKSLLYQHDTPVNLEKMDKMQVFINLKDGKILEPEIIDSRDIIPESMQSNENNIFVFLPLVYRNNLYGYYCGKNNLKLLFNKRGYSWSKNMANSIEKFCEKNRYRLLSQKYLGLSTRDTLSDSYNRTALDLFAKEMYETNRHSDYYTILYFIDINDMKFINDKHGHLHGDMAIKIVAEEIKELIPLRWYLIRYGGDEFVIIGYVEDVNYRDYLHNINDLLKERCKKLSLPYTVSVSVGFNIVPPDSVLSLNDEINKVDKIMYKNKKEFHSKN